MLENLCKTHKFRSCTHMYCNTCPVSYRNRRLTVFTIESVPTLSSVGATRMMRFLFNLWFKSELRSFWCTLYMDLWCRSMRWNFWFFSVESAPVHKFGPPGKTSLTGNNGKTTWGLGVIPTRSCSIITLASGNSLFWIKLPFRFWPILY